MSWKFFIPVFLALFIFLSCTDETVAPPEEPPFVRNDLAPDSVIPTLVCYSGFAKRYDVIMEDPDSNRVYETILKSDSAGALVPLSRIWFKFLFMGYRTYMVNTKIYGCDALTRDSFRFPVYSQPLKLYTIDGTNTINDTINPFRVFYLPKNANVKFKFNLDSLTFSLTTP